MTVRPCIRSELADSSARLVCAGHDVESLHHEGLSKAIFLVPQKSSRRQLLALVDHLAQLATTDEWQSAALW